MGVEFQISEGTYRCHLNWRGEEELRCARCGKKIVPGDWIHRSNAPCHLEAGSRGGGKPPELTRFYHLSCYEEMFVSV
jgi:hypothetical protein